MKERGRAHSGAHAAMEAGVVRCGQAATPLIALLALALLSCGAGKHRVEGPLEASAELGCVRRLPGPEERPAQCTPELAACLFEDRPGMKILVTRRPTR